MVQIREKDMSAGNLARFASEVIARCRTHGALAIVKGGMRWAGIKASLIGTAHATAMIFLVLLGALTVASFVYAIFAHQADQATAYFNSFARGWELLAGALAGALVGFVRLPMWLRTAMATVGLAAILACG